MQQCRAQHTSILIQPHAPAQERALCMLRSADGSPSLNWSKDKAGVMRHCGVTAAEVNAHEREWPLSAEGQRLLAGLR